MSRLARLVTSICAGAIAAVLAIQPVADAFWKPVLNTTSGFGPRADIPRNAEMLSDPLGRAILGIVFIATTIAVFAALTWWNRRHA